MINPDYSEFGNRKFSFIPAAIFPKDHAGLGIYVKYKYTNTEQVILNRNSTQYKHIIAPDRELLIVRDSYKDTGIRPLDDNWDEFINLSNFTPMANDFDNPMYMINYAQHMLETSDYNFKLAKTFPYGKNGRKYKMLADSGGFQLLKGRVEFISPKEVAEWYHNNVDVGIALDIPMSTDESDLLFKSAHIQKLNTNEMFDTLSGINSHVELMNVSHGTNYDDQLTYLDIVHDPRSRRLAVGDIYRNSVMESVHLLSKLIYNIKDDYDHLHVLGVYNQAILPSLILMANKYPIKFLTSDSSTHLQAGINKMYIHQVLPETPMRRIWIGTKNATNSRAFNDANKVLPCNCPVCGSIKYFDIISHLDGSLIAFTLAQHNMFEITRYTKYMNNMAAKLSPEDYISLVISQMHSKSAEKETTSALKYIYEVAATANPDKVAKKYSMYLAQSLFNTHTKSSLFDGKDNAPENNDEEPSVDNTAIIIEKFRQHHLEEKKVSNKYKTKQIKKDLRGGSVFSKRKKFKDKAVTKKKRNAIKLTN